MNRWTTNLSWALLPVFACLLLAPAAQEPRDSGSSSMSQLEPPPSQLANPASLLSGSSELNVDSEVSILPDSLTLEALESLPDTTKEALQRRRERFESLTEAERESLRNLHRRLTAHEDAERLEHVLVNYNRWLESLTSIERAELADMSIEARIEKIKEIKRRQEEEMLQKLADRAVIGTDIEVIGAWAGEMSMRYDAELESRLPASMRQGSSNSRRPPSDNSRPSPRFWLFSFQLNTLNDVLNDSDMELLIGRLSPNAASVLEREMTREQRLEQIVRWLAADWISRMRPAPEVLEEFFREELTDQERADLDQRSPQDRMEALRDMYLRRRFPRNRGRGPFTPPPSSSRSSGTDTGND